MKRFALLFSSLLLVAACKPVTARPVDESAEAEAPAGRALAAPATYGSPIDPATPEVALAELARDPAKYAGQRVRARGTVHRVCQRAGCWIELADRGVAPVFVPMAGHAFSLPREAQGQRAEVEGTIQLRTMTREERAHFESEGATATHTTAQVVASGVRLEGGALQGS